MVSVILHTAFIEGQLSTMRNSLETLVLLALKIKHLQNAHRKPSKKCHNSEAEHFCRMSEAIKITPIDDQCVNTGEIVSIKKIFPIFLESCTHNAKVYRCKIQSRISWWFQHHKKTRKLRSTMTVLWLKITAILSIFKEGTNQPLLVCLWCSRKLEWLSFVRMSDKVCFVHNGKFAKILFLLQHIHGSVSK